MARPKKVTPEFENIAPVRRAAKKVLSKEELLTSIRLSIKCKNETQKKLINTKFAKKKKSKQKIEYHSL